ncbi:ABC transporter permease [Arthrobacter sedimenti]|uniref:ABC transporter permease n=1 Tax=Arthrobacter sedimenti TaxID=2694931 RepID=UPI000B34BC72|nr:ABC transporter permease [Arthrobacter sedimenti]OUM41933.1 ABC transporter permease [Arthrobacter agilis]
MKNQYQRFVLTRAGQAVVVVLLAYVLTFLVISVLPGDSITNSLRDPQRGLSEEEIQRIVAFYGLDKPVVVQLVLSLGRFLSGDLGFSLQSNLPVAQLIGDALPSTLALASSALALAVIFAVAIAYGAHYLPGKWASLLRSVPSLFLSVPNFVIGLVLIELFAFRLHAFTTIDTNSAAATVFAAVTLAIPVSAPLAEVFIASLDHESRQEYAVVARSRGLSEARLFVQHLAKPSALPAVAMVALIVGELLGGAVITETIFGRDGIGTLVQKAVTGEDQPVLQAVVSLSAIVFVAVNLVADLASPLVDPRIELREVVDA